MKANYKNVEFPRDLEHIKPQDSPTSHCILLFTQYPTLERLHKAYGSCTTSNLSNINEGILMLKELWRIRRQAPEKLDFGGGDNITFANGKVYVGYSFRDSIHSDWNALPKKILHLSRMKKQLVNYLLAQGLILPTDERIK